MAGRNVVVLKVYIDRDMALAARAAAAAEGTNVSAFVRLSLSERLSNGVRPPGERRMLEYLVGGINQVLAERDPARLKEHQRRHAERMAQGKSYAD